MPYFTVFTPTYNRAYILPKLYQSLREQTCKDFEWMIVDDGSTDDTGKLVARSGKTRIMDLISTITRSRTAGNHVQSTLASPRQMAIFSLWWIRMTT